VCGASSVSPLVAAMARCSVEKTYSLSESFSPKLSPHVADD